MAKMMKGLKHKAHPPITKSSGGARGAKVGNKPMAGGMRKGVAKSPKSMGGRDA